MRYTSEPEHTHGNPAPTGILLVNLGTPDAADAAALQRYLDEFLWDPRVVEIPRPVWWLILKGIILNVRPRKSAAKYASIWMPEGSPLMVHTQKTGKLLRAWLNEHARGPLQVEVAMRYGKPSIHAALTRLKAAGCQRLLVVPLYPQYAASTTASVQDKVFDFFKRTRRIPALRIIDHFHDDPGYIEALARNVRDYWQREGQPDVLVMSFHGLPRYTLTRGDPYHCECHKTGRLLAEALGLSADQYRVCFQSRFGRAEWLQPYTDKTLMQLGHEGTTRVDVVCPGFVADCLETLEEIAMEGRDTFLHAGGKAFHYIPALNDHPAWIAALGQLVMAHTDAWGTQNTPEEQKLSQSRALARGTER
jgi:ferrochelatase